MVALGTTRSSNRVTDSSLPLPTQNKHNFLLRSVENEAAAGGGGPLGAAYAAPTFVTSKHILTPQVNKNLLVTDREM